ncbi:nucleobase:cation symporter-2 family protein [Streptomyces sp. ITFR-16]|uniref:nucleobase:cation symporter-2 family protein n=1 Tax=Streptomyces sp. ITFR-16 TaxID=3075198 RepID=UPI0028899302|nr:nucleobase:cation symporter-2 family protein [Streptomyces sp. ITFR-16]WNI24983.1 nucleobase:cation symporter-2 family protein [Streptomyces sp. ITFR-16]
MTDTTQAPPSGTPATDTAGGTRAADRPDTRARRAARMRRTPGGDGRPGAAPAPVPAGDPVDAVPVWWRLLALGLQHVLAFYAGAVVMPLLVAQGMGLSPADTASLVNTALVACGVATLLQTVGLPGIGIRLPVVQGMSTAAVPSLVSVGVAAGGARAGLPTVFGAVIVAGLMLFLVAPVFGRLVRFFPPLVTGTIVIIVGVTLMAVSARQVGGGNPDAPGFGTPAQLGLAAVTLAVIVVLHRFGKGFVTSVAILLGLAAGTVVAALAGRTDFSGISGADWFGIQPPLHYGMPRFDVMAVLAIVLVMVIIAVESVGQFFAIGEIAGREVDARDMSRALRADGLATVASGLLNSFPTTVYSQNVGLLRLTRVSSRWVVAAGAVMMLLLGLVPKVGAVVAAMPPAVLGGATLVLFSTIVVVGVQMLVKADLSEARNTVLVAASLGIGFLPTAYPQFAEHMPTRQLRILFESGIMLGTLAAVLLNLFFHHLGRRSGPREAPTVPAETG